MWRTREHRLMYVCKECGGKNVQHVAWVSTNTHEVRDDYGTWCHGDNSWCEDCEEHTQLVELETEKRRTVWG